jgi:hypothetical protein
MEDAEARKLLELAYDRAKAEYAEYSDNWKLLESKAQGTITAGGVFLAALFAIGYQHPELLTGRIQQFLSTVVLLSLAAAIGFAMWSLRVREYETPMSTKDTWERVRHAIESETTAEALVHAHNQLLKEFMKHLVPAIRDLWRFNDDKAGRFIVLTSRSFWGR